MGNDDELSEYEREEKKREVDELVNHFLETDPHFEIAHTHNNLVRAIVAVHNRRVAPKPDGSVGAVHPEVLFNDFLRKELVAEIEKEWRQVTEIGKADWGFPWNTGHVMTVYWKLVWESDGANYHRSEPITDN